MSSHGARERSRRGALAEHIAVRHIVAMGMHVLARNLRVGHLELDIVARDGPAVVVIEVRTRGSGAWQTPLDSVGGVKRSRLRRAAEILWDRHWSRWEGVERVRFDVVSVRLGRGTPARVDYVRAAFF